MAFRTNKTPVLQTKSASGAIASFDTILTKPLEECTSLITGWQEGTGTPSSDNVRPLHAFSSASLGKCDNNTASLWSIDNSFNGDVEFNQLSKDMTEISQSYLPTKWYVTYGTASVSNEIATLTPNTQYGRLNCFFPYVANHKILVSGDLKLSNANNAQLVTLSIYAVDSSASGISRCSPTTDWQTLSAIYTDTVATPNSNRIILTDARTSDFGTIQAKNIICIDLTAMFGSTIADYIYNLETQTAGAGVAFFKALYPNDYYPYNAGTKQLIGDTLATFTFGQSIYQGSIDWKRGVVVGTHLLKDMGSLSWSINGTYTALCDFRSSSLQDIIKNGTDSVASDINTEIFETVSRNKQIADDVIDSIAVSNTGRLIVYGDINTYPDIATFRSAMNGVYLAYELATPIEIQLSGIQIATIRGSNTIFADTGDVDLTYKDLDLAKRGNFREVFKLPS